MAKKNGFLGKIFPICLLCASMWMVIFPPESKGPKRKIPQAQRAKAVAQVEDAGLRGPYIIGDREQQIIRTYMRQDTLANCPPRLAKTNCLPRNYANKSYTLGQALPDNVNPLPLPPALRSQLRNLPHGMHYAVLDSDVLLISDTTFKVMDAITLSSVLEKE